MHLKNIPPFLLLQGWVWCGAALGFFWVNSFPADLPGLCFAITSLIGHMFLFAWLLGCLSAPFTWAGPRALQAACIGWGSFFSVLLAADLFVFTQYRFHIGLAMLQMFFGPAGREIFVFPLSMWLLTAAGVLLIIALEIALVWLAKRWAIPGKWLVGIASVWFICFVLYNGLYAYGKFMFIPSIMTQQRVLPLAHPLSANRFLSRLGLTSKENPYQLPGKGALQYPLAPLTCQTAPNPKNILILLVDSWRADTFHPDVMPRLFAWAQKPGMSVFTNHLSGGNSTEGGVFSLFYSLPHSYWDDFTSLHLPPVLVSHALSAGYEPAIFASSQLTSPAFNRNIFSQVHNLRLGSQGSTSWQRDENAVEDFEKFLDTRHTSQPFFGFVFLDAPHAYSYPPQAKRFTPAKEMNYLLLNNHTDPGPYLNHYKNAVYYTDQLLDRVLSALQTRQLLENTLILISGDHGQELNDSRHNFWGHNGNFTDYQIKVPLLLYQPGTPGPRRVEYRTTHYDIAPTLMQRVFNCTSPVYDYSIGHNLFEDTPRRAVFAGHTDKAIRAEDKIIVFNNFGAVQLYDAHLQPTSQGPDPAAIREGLKTFSRFYK